MPTASRHCPTCGRPLDDHNRQVKFKRPDSVFAIPDSELEGRVWGDDPLLAVKDVGFFIRTLMPVALTGGFTVTYGVWIEIESDDLHNAWRVWHLPEYVNLRLTGLLANAAPPWGDVLLGASVSAAPRDPDEIPYIIASTEPNLGRILTTEWPHEKVLAFLPP